MSCVFFTTGMTYCSFAFCFVPVLIVPGITRDVTITAASAVAKQRPRARTLPAQASRYSYTTTRFLIRPWSEYVHILCTRGRSNISWSLTVVVRDVCGLHVFSSRIYCSLQPRPEDRIRAHDIEHTGTAHECLSAQKRSIQDLFPVDLHTPRTTVSCAPLPCSI